MPHLHKYLADKQFITNLDRLMMVVSVLYPLSALPQVWAIYHSHDVTGVSLLTWFLFMLAGVVFLSYGLAHRIKPLIVTQVLWFIVDILVVVGVLMYR